MKIETDFTSQEVETIRSLFPMGILDSKEVQEYRSTLYRKLLILEANIHVKERKEALNEQI